jgi:hypothetical protein
MAMGTICLCCCWLFFGFFYLNSFPLISPVGANLRLHVLFTVEAPEQLGGHKHVLTLQLAGLEEFLQDLANFRLVLVGPGGVNQAVAIFQGNAKSICNIPFV